MNKPAEQQRLSIALVGAPNCGKTALFNALTGAKGKVANYAGVTVDKRSAPLIGHEYANLIDLPGTYGLAVTSLDEAVTHNTLLGLTDGEPRPDAIIMVADATNIRMSLRLLLELKTLGLPILMALNLSDVAHHRGLNINTDILSRQLDLPVIETTAIQPKAGVKDLILALPEFLRLKPEHSGSLIHFNAATMAAKIDEFDSQALYQEVDAIVAEAVEQSSELPYWHESLDSFVMHPIGGMLLLLVILFTVFQAVYAWSAPFMDALEWFFTWFGELIQGALPDDSLLAGLLVDGVIAGVGGVLVFIPQIAILFLFILLLEDSGYLPRAAFLMDNILVRLGLSGRSFIPLLSSFACAVPAVMSARTIADPRERLVTIVVAPMLTCSARLPVYALIIAAIIPQKTVWGAFNLQGLTLFVLYIVGIVSVALLAWLMKIFAAYNSNLKAFPLLMELPTYRMPNVRHIALALWDRVSAFLKRAGTIIFALSIVLWVLVTFPAAPAESVRPAIEYSFAAMLGQILLPVFEPLGFTWEMCVAMIPGMAAREVVVSALGTVYAVSAVTDDAAHQSLIPVIQSSWGLATAFAFLAWYVYAPMCLATLTVIKRETKSWRYTLMITLYLFVLAYTVAWLVYRLASYWLA